VVGHLKELLHSIRSLFRRRREEQQLDEELQFHLERQSEQNLAAGMSPEEARYAALRLFGGVQQVKEQCRDMREVSTIENFLQDLRYGLRMLVNIPGFTAVVVLSLALGIGANTAIFSLIDAVMLKMLPVSNPEQLRLLSWAAQSQPGIMPANGIIHSLSGNMDQDRTGRMTSTSFSYPTFEQIHARNDVFSDVFAFADPDRVNLNVSGQAQLAEAELVSGSYFSGLALGTVVGRTITEADDLPGAAPVAVIGYGYWERRFGGEPSVLGRRVTINNIPFTIIGVSSPEFFGLQPGRAIDVWLPLHTQPQVEPRWSEEGDSKFIRRDDWWVMIVGRLKPGVREQQARAALEVTFQQSIGVQQEAAQKAATLKKSPEQAHQPVSQALPHLELASASKGLNDLRREFSKPLFILMAVVGLVLLIACANVANLLLARATTRRKEIAVRLAIGAGRRRLIRQLLTESVMLAALGGGFGLLLAYWTTSLLITFMSSGRYPITLNVRPDVRVLAFTVAVSLVTGVLFGLAPASRTTRVDVTTALKETSSGSSSGIHYGRVRLGLGKALVVSQVAMSLLLLVGAGLFVRTLQKLENLDVGFNRRNILLFGVDPTQNGYKGEKLRALYQELQRRIEALPGVLSASLSNHTLIGGGVTVSGFSIRRATPKRAATGRDGAGGVHFNGVGPQFFETMGIPLMLGRTIGPEDKSGAPKVAVINETLARKYFEGSNPIGRHFSSDNQWATDIEIVGVVGDARYADLRKKVPPTVYVPYTQTLEGQGPMHFEVRTSGDPIAMILAVRHVVQDVDKSLPLFELRTQVEQIDQTLFQERLFARLTSFFGVLALALACVGLYGLMSYAVARRTNEIGIRMALGAEGARILAMVLREGLVLVSLGCVLGVPAALAATHLVATMLYGLKSTDPITIAVAVALMAAVAIVASYLPAIRAARVDPMVALRYE
jgi:predicted permease